MRRICLLGDCFVFTCLMDCVCVGFVRFLVVFLVGLWLVVGLQVCRVDWLRRLSRGIGGFRVGFGLFVVGVFLFGFGLIISCVLGMSWTYVCFCLLVCYLFTSICLRLMGLFAWFDCWLLVVFVTSGFGSIACCFGCCSLLAVVGWLCFRCLRFGGKGLGLTGYLLVC